MLVSDYWYVSDKTTNYCYNGTSFVDIGNILKLGKGTVTPVTTTFFSKTKNFINEANIKVGIALSTTDGSETKNASFNTIENIPLSALATYCLSHLETGLYFQAFVIQRDANKTFLGFIQLMSTNGVNALSFTTIANTASIDICYQINQSGVIPWTLIQLELGTVRTIYALPFAFDINYLKDYSTGITQEIASSVMDYNLKLIMLVLQAFY